MALEGEGISLDVRDGAVTAADEAMFEGGEVTASGLRRAPVLARIWSAGWPYLAVFGASWCMLGLEIVAARLLAPIIGVSVLTWTGVIGVMLAGMSLGNMWGGALADRGARRRELGLILGMGGALSLLSLPLLGFMGSLLSDVPYVARILALAAALFFLPSVCMGMVTPIVVKIALNDLSAAGRVVGRLYAVSTAGGIAGVFAVGFWLLSVVGSRSIVIGIAFTLVVMGVAFGDLLRLRRLKGALMGGGLALAFSLALGSAVLGAGPYACDEETKYFCLRIHEGSVGGRQVEILQLDSLIHSYVDLDDDRFLGYVYERSLGEIAAYIAERRPAFKTLVIGGGGYTLPRYLLSVYPESEVDVIELDPAVTRSAHERLGLKRNARLATFQGDARMEAPRLDAGKYHFVSGDAYNDVSVPYHLTTLEYTRDIKRLMAPGGIYAVNILDTMDAGGFLRATARTMGAAFEYVYIIRGGQITGGSQRDTIIVAASDEPIVATDLYAAGSRAGFGGGAAVMMADADFAAFMAEADAPILTDDYAPVDWLLLPVLLDR